jgi:thiol-disulfide isomerase/thioredoxin
MNQTVGWLTNSADSASGNPLFAEQAFRSLNHLGLLRSLEKETSILLTKRSNLILLSVAGLVVLGIAVYFVFFAGSDYVEGRPTFKYFRLETWEFCQQMNPIVDEVKKNYAQKINFVFIEMHTPQGKEEARDEGVMGTPTFIFLNGDGERVYMIQGVQQRVILEQHLDELLAREES